MRRRTSARATEAESILVKGAREHNLDIRELAIPKRKLVVFTGVSGSGKSSLAFDTLYAEGQRRYVESLSSYARQFLGQMEKPHYDHIRGLSPTIAIEQKSASSNPRSTVGTVTEIYDYLRVLYARAGEQRCHQCGGPVASRSADEIVEELLALPKGTKATVLAPKVDHRKGEFRELFDEARKAGFARVRVDGMIVRLEDVQALEKLKKHTIELVVDRVALAREERARLTDSVETALREGQRQLRILIEGEDRPRAYSESRGCPNCGVGLPELSPQMLSFNSPLGMCTACNGLGRVELGYEYGDDGWSLEGETCSACQGLRLRPEARSVFVAEKSIAEACALTVGDAAAHFRGMKLSGAQAQIAVEVLKEVNARLGFLLDVGLDYLTLDRGAATLSGGEAQRIRLASQLGSELSGVMYVLDEPSIGLHQRDNLRLIRTLRRLRDLGNSVLVVEHDAETIEAADWVIDFGPGAGRRGGRVVSQGTPRELARDPQSPTGRYLSGRDRIEVPDTRRRPARFIELRGASENNLRDVDARFPLGVLCAVTGVSGAGKSTLVNQVLHPALKRIVYDSEHLRVGKHKSLRGVEHIDKVIDIDQNPIGRTPRSNPATYTKAFDHIRELFAGTPEARTYGYGPGRFSFNVRGGRCEACEGDGVREVEMHFLPNVHVTCEVCRGKRYNEATLRVRFKHKSICEVLETTVAEALELFANQPRLLDILKTLDDVGLGYLQLGQPATTLSGGEAQRIKLSRELAKRDTGRTFYILDEPTTGLHFSDVKRLMDVLDRLVAGGNTVIVIEHNLDVIKRADWVIDLGPEGGARGGEIIAEGTPEQVARVARSYTGQFLRRVLPARARRSLA
jgi:excinuclease ABC subunit A